uniref:Uncharacterized protein n=1 Tax=Monodelphis domestica TaxID=13616 RepID=A0A5F8HA46_MONDO
MYKQRLIPSSWLSKASRDSYFYPQRSYVRVLHGTLYKHRKFLENGKLQVSLKNCDPQKDKYFSNIVRLKFTP